MERWAEGFIAVDWGTTNRRAYLVDRDGNCVEDFEDERGVLKVERGQFESAVADIRERLGDKPMLLAGMIGSNRGWIEAPYVRCPAGSAELADNLAWTGDRSVAIVPGVCVSDGDPDVMRGEEVQLVGAVALREIPDDCVVCHPGTHNKWVVVANGRIAKFRTVLTGEMFSLLKERSILSELLAGEAKADEAFAEGARRGLSGSGITAELFGARARALIGQLDRSDGASYVSGLLIGEDVRFGLSEFESRKVYLLGRPELTALYSAVLDIAGIDCRTSDGEQAFVAGAARIVEAIG